MRYAPLFLLELRRSLGGGLLPFVFLILILLARAGASPLDQILEDGERARIARGLTRQSAWAGALLLIAPVFVLSSASRISRWRKGEAEWLGSRPTRRLPVLLSALLGSVGATAILFACTALWVELRTERGSDIWRYAGSFALDEDRRLDPGGRRTFVLPDPRTARGESARLRIRLTPTVGGAPFSEASVRAGRTNSEATPESTTATVGARTWAELSCPEGEGDIELSVENTGEGSLAIVGPRAVQLFLPGGSERRASLALFLHALLGVAGIQALALGLGAWLGPMAAGGTAFALWLASSLVPRAASAWIPGARIAEALALVGEGRLPAPLDLRVLSGLCLLVALGLGLAILGLRSWRHGP